MKANKSCIQWNCAIYSNVDGPKDCNTQWNKSEKQILYNNACMWNLEKWYRQSYLQSWNRHADVENKCRDTRGERGTLSARTAEEISQGTEARASSGTVRDANLWGAAGVKSLLFSFPTDQKFSPTGPFNFPIILLPSWIFHVPPPHVHISLSGGLAYSNTHNFLSPVLLPTQVHSDPPSG